jgi:coenzyme F420 hydrogenase subunit gamma
MGLLSALKKLITGEGQETTKSPPKPEAKPVVEPVAEVVEKPAEKPADVKIEQKVEVKKEEKPVAEKITAGHVHLSGCTGCLVSLADNYEGLFKLLDDYVDWVYDLTLADVRHVPEMDVAFVEGSVCLNQDLAVEELRETRKKSKVVVALGGCACYGNITRFGRGGQWNQPAHEAYAPIGDVIDVDVYIPGCAPTPQQILHVAVMAYLLLKGTDEQKELATSYLKPLMDLAKRGTEACGCDLMFDVINQSLCMGCGLCAASCPVRAIEMVFGKPQIDTSMCIKCGACYAQCPRSFMNLDVINEFEGISELIAAAMATGGE